MDDSPDQAIATTVRAQPSNPFAMSAYEPKRTPDDWSVRASACFRVAWASASESWLLFDANSNKRSPSFTTWPALKLILLRSPSRRGATSASRSLLLRDSVASRRLAKERRTQFWGPLLRLEIHV